MPSRLIREIEEKDIDTVIDMTLEFERYLISVDDGMVSEVLSREVYERVLRAGLDDDRHLFLVMEEEGEVIGFADLWTYPEFLHGGISADMHNLFIREDRRMEGRGAAMVERIISEAKRAGAVALHVPVKSKNLDAIRCYRRMGIDTEYTLLEARI